MKPAAVILFSKALWKPKKKTAASLCYLVGGENEEDVSSSVYYLNFEENRWDLKSEEMVSGVTETTIHSSYAVINLDMDLE